MLRRAGHAETAQRQVIDAAAGLQHDLHRGPEYLSVYGSLLSTAAYTAAVDGDRDTAHTLIGEAVHAAGRLGVDGNHRFTAFGPTGVRLYQISIARVLGDSGTAIDAARRINPTTIPQTERQARYWSDVARSFHQWGKPEQCYGRCWPPNTPPPTRCAIASPSSRSPPACCGIPPRTPCPVCAVSPAVPVCRPEPRHPSACR